MKARDIHFLLKALGTKNLDLIDSLQERYNCIFMFEYVIGVTDAGEDIFEERKIAKDEVISEVIGDLQIKFPNCINDDCAFLWNLRTENFYFTFEDDIGLSFTVMDRKKEITREMIKEMKDVMAAFIEGGAIMHPFSYSERNKLFTKILIYEDAYEQMRKIYNALDANKQIQVEQCMWYIQRYKYFMAKTYEYRLNQVNMVLNIIDPKEIVYGPA